MMRLEPDLEFPETPSSCLDQRDCFSLKLDFALPAKNGLHRRQNIHAGGELRLHQLCANLSRRFGIGEGREQEENVLGRVVLSLDHEF